MTSLQNNQQITKRNRRMNQKIAIIIITDFMCWVPFIVICILHSLEVLDATPWYSIFSIVILPINSVINPLLYDDVMTNAIRVHLRTLSTRISTSTIYQSARRSFNPAPTETVDLERIEMQDGIVAASAGNGTVELKEGGSQHNQSAGDKKQKEDHTRIEYQSHQQEVIKVNKS